MGFAQLQLGGIHGWGAPRPAAAGGLRLAFDAVRGRTVQAPPAGLPSDPARPAGRRTVAAPGRGLTDRPRSDSTGGGGPAPVADPVASAGLRPGPGARCRRWIHRVMQLAHDHRAKDCGGIAGETTTGHNAPPGCVHPCSRRQPVSVLGSLIPALCRKPGGYPVGLTGQTGSDSLVVLPKLQHPEGCGSGRHIGHRVHDARLKAVHAGERVSFPPGHCIRRAQHRSGRALPRRAPPAGVLRSAGGRGGHPGDPGLPSRRARGAGRRTQITVAIMLEPAGGWCVLRPFGARPGALGVGWSGDRFHGAGLVPSASRCLP